MNWKDIKRLGYQNWIVTGHDTFLDDLVRTKAQNDVVTDRQVQHVLKNVRFHQVVDPWVELFSTAFKLLWRQTYGRYRKPSAPVHVSATQAAGAGAGAAGFAAAANPAPGWATAPAGPGGTFEDAGIRAGEVVAYRCWVLRDGVLHSAYRSHFAWTPGETVEGNPTQPGEGVHGFKKRIDACSYIESYEDDLTKVVSGTVDLWGDVYEHERGYRASKARIASIDDSPNYDAAALRKQYGLNKKKRKKPSAI